MQYSFVSSSKVFFDLRSRSNPLSLEFLFSFETHNLVVLLETCEEEEMVRFFEFLKESILEINCWNELTYQHFWLDKNRSILNCQLSAKTNPSKCHVWLRFSPIPWSTLFFFCNRSVSIPFLLL